MLCSLVNSTGVRDSVFFVIYRTVIYRITLGPTRKPKGFFNQCHELKWRTLFELLPQGAVTMAILESTIYVHLLPRWKTVQASCSDQDLTLLTVQEGMTALKMLPSLSLLMEWNAHVQPANVHLVLMFLWWPPNSICFLNKWPAPTPISIVPS